MFGLGLNTGKQAEDIAAKYLQSQGYKIVARNYRCKGGEIDLICSCDKMLVFVEVRHRTSSHFGSGADTVSTNKQRKITLAANIYLLEKYGDRPPACRFDVISTDGPTFKIDWLKNAFGDFS